MDLSSLKQRLGRVPVLGQAMRALRGVYSLPLWREDLRRDVALSHERADALSSVQDAMAQRQEAQAARLAELEQAVTAQLARFDQSRLRQDDAVAGFAQRLHALEADLQHALRSVQQLQLQALTGLAADAPAASGLAAEVAQPVPLAGLASTEAQRFAPFMHVLQPLQVAGAQALLLHEDARAAWVEILAGQAEAGLTAVIVPAGAEEGDAPAFERLLGAAFTALSPGGVCIVQMPNPENLSVASELLLAGSALRIMAPARAERLARLAGYGEATILRFDADEDEAAVANAPATDDAQLRRLLHGPRQYAVVARRAA